jgi:hypothetical protein
MNRIIIDVSKGELDFMREALETKHSKMMDNLNACAENFIRKEVLNSVQPAWGNVADLTEEEFLAQVEAIKEEEKIFKYKPKKKAPYGLKKDGTPKAKPGRKV